MDRTNVAFYRKFCMLGLANILAQYIGVKWGSSPRKHEEKPFIFGSLSTTRNQLNQLLTLVALLWLKLVESEGRMHPSEMKNYALVAAAKAERDGFSATAEALMLLACACAAEARALQLEVKDGLKQSHSVSTVDVTSSLVLIH